MRNLFFLLLIFLVSCSYKEVRRETTKCLVTDCKKIGSVSVLSEIERDKGWLVNSSCGHVFVLRNQCKINDTVILSKIFYVTSSKDTITQYMITLQ